MVGWGRGEGGDGLHLSLWMSNLFIDTSLIWTCSLFGSLALVMNLQQRPHVSNHVVARPGLDGGCEWRSVALRDDIRISHMIHSMVVVVVVVVVVMV